ncbi:MAG: methylenetetrahydrofolate--tRNA-(uracil(54)-C(5))-methyltransferase (FADH(2)-oxidizing) TrmFO [Deltaproteobacteria bacterium]|nr:methylenetetrahydrofolate--tRNA-(uracil(54)-C(5))-methyltransferase (FADH(2)-oxidizing) TrmFO [Deltaproteobacteria bacterium]MBW2595607.1 methylenetetrahydrofolate--tRNA-(uracil(54)-C(5))-methyltransferase (FADH(2)-oxidizing) TrmFO [Deltaproteobacteria bacterium]MBW2650243.1 methylenetetrahydrofolate--tRNA-(uracil(54)-C(5))-methyltransferase (FADH(2)-oxidizing) TrmFO [Deltaproteobacteria bacterium]
MYNNLKSDTRNSQKETHPKPIIIIGGGLAGCEAAWQISRRSADVLLYEMKPALFSPAHKSPLLAELVCSNSFRSNATESAVGLLKEEMRVMGSLIMEAADATAVPAGKALAVDRTLFSNYIEDRLASTGTRIIREEVTSIPEDSIVIIATGPLTSESLAKSIASVTGNEYLYFYDAISPIVDAQSIDYGTVFRASRYDSSGEGDYLNCPMTRDEYERFWTELSSGDEMPLRDFEDRRCFEGCLPVEVLARRGIKTLLFGPMKPVGLTDPKTGKRPHAVVQLRQENSEGTLYNLVGFQTKLTWPEQKRVLRMIPGLEKADFARYGSIHRNTFINSPALLNKSLQLRSDDNIFVAGQITGVEGYVESAAMGLVAGINACCWLTGSRIVPPETTALGALLSHITNADYKTFQPMNVNFGLFPSLEKRVPKKMRGRYYAERSLTDLKMWEEELIASRLLPEP